MRPWLTAARASIDVNQRFAGAAVSHLAELVRDYF
jgi:hypothetical protein